MLNLMRAEWIKLARRPMAWLLLVVFLLLLAMFATVQFLVVGLNDGIVLGWIFGGETTIEIGRPELVSQFRRETSFPGIFGNVLGQINSIGGICAVILAAGALGSEYSWGTLRLQLARQPQRGRYLLAKIITLLLILLLGMDIGLLAGSLLALLYGSILGNVGSVSLRDLLLLPFGMLRALYVILPYVMFTLAICTIGRSVFAGVAGGLVFLFLDGGIGSFSFLSELDNPLITFLLHLFLQPNINTLILLNRSMYGFEPSAITTMNVELLPSPLQATIVVALYSALFAGYTYYALTRRDIGGAT